MPKTLQYFTNSETENFASESRTQLTCAPAVASADMPSFLEDWLLDCEIAGHSPRTNAVRRNIVSRLLWFLEDQNSKACGSRELRQFFAYLGKGHLNEGGRWGNEKYSKPLRPGTLQNYYKHLHCYFNWIVREEHLQTSPMHKVPRPIGQADQIQPFTPEQVKALLRAAQQSKYPRRDVAIVTMLFDCGLRASELCNLRWVDVDLDSFHCKVLGKGNKFRTVPIGRATKQALWRYLRNEPLFNDRPLFCSERGLRTGSALTRLGLLQLIARLGKKANISVARCSPHTFRHTMAVEFLRNGGDVFTLKLLLGHSSLHMTNRYVALAQADIQHQHRRFSPADRLLQGHKPN